MTPFPGSQNDDEEEEDDVTKWRSEAIQKQAKTNETPQAEITYSL